MAKLENCIISKNGGLGVYVTETLATRDGIIANNTIDGNAGHAIRLTQQAVGLYRIYNNIISNHTTSGTYPITCDAGTTAQNDRQKMFIDYNVFYNNLNAPNAISYGLNDNRTGSNPYVDQPNDDYTLTSTYINTGYPQTKFPGY